MDPTDIESAFRRMIDAYPDARVAAVNEHGLFCAVPAAVPLAGQRPLPGRAGIQLVAPESRPVVLEQFRWIDEQGASEVEVRLASGGAGRFALFDTRAAYGVRMLVVIEGDAGERPGPVALPELAPVRPRYGRELRTELAGLIEVDDGVLGLLGYSRERFLALTIADAIHPDDQPVLRGHWFDLVASSPGSTRRARVRYRRGDGSWLWLELTLTRLLQHTGEAYVMVEMVDISEEMAAMDEVWQNRELLHRLTEALPIGVLQIDAAGRVVHANDRLHQIVGVPRVEHLDAQLASLIDDDRTVLGDAVHDVLHRGPAADLELRLRRRGEALRYVQVAIRALHDRADTVTGAILCVTDVTESTRMRQELELRASFDMLTGCLNRAMVMAELERRLAAERAGLAVVFVDLDGFKPINDRLGHAAGDRLLRTVADSLQQAVRSGDLVGRLGGDEFVVLCPGVASREHALELGERIADAVHIDAPIAGERVAIRGSIGVAWTASAGTGAEALVAAADAAMYRSKRAGGQRVMLAA